MAFHARITTNGDVDQLRVNIDDSNASRVSWRDGSQGASPSQRGNPVVHTVERAIGVAEHHKQRAATLESELQAARADQARLQRTQAELDALRRQSANVSADRYRAVSSGLAAEEAAEGRYRQKLESLENALAEARPYRSRAEALQLELAEAHAMRQRYDQMEQELARSRSMSAAFEALQAEVNNLRREKADLEARLMNENGQRETTLEKEQLRVAALQNDVARLTEARDAAALEYAHQLGEQQKILEAQHRQRMEALENEIHLLKIKNASLESSVDEAEKEKVRVQLLEAEVQSLRDRAAVEKIGISAKFYATDLVDRLKDDLRRSAAEMLDETDNLPHIMSTVTAHLPTLTSFSETLSMGGIGRLAKQQERHAVVDLLVEERQERLKMECAAFTSLNEALAQHFYPKVMRLNKPLPIKYMEPDARPPTWIEGGDGSDVLHSGVIPPSDSDGSAPYDDDQ